MTQSSTQAKDYNVFVIAGVFLLGAFICYLNSTFMNVALSDIMKDLNISVSTAQWLSTGYMLTTGIIIPFTAFLIDKFKNRTLFFISIGLFTIGTIIGAFATNFAMLLTARLIQGFASGIIIPLMQTVFMIIFPIEKRGFAMGIVGIVLAFAPAIGPTLSGWIINIYPWRYLFYVTLPFAILDLILGYFLLKNVTENKSVYFDFISFIGSTIGFGGLLFGFSNAGNYSWTDINVYLSLIIGIVFLIIFVWRQLNMEEPMLNLAVFKSTVFTFATIISMIAYAGLISSELILPMYLEDVRGSSAFDTGLTLMPGAIVMGIMNPITGKLFDKFGARYLALTGLTILTLGTFGLSFLSVSTPIIYIISIYAIRMLGISMLLMPLSTSALNSLHKNLYAHGNAANNTLRQVAGSIGTSLIVTLMSKSTISSGYTDPAKAQVYGMNISFACTAALTLVGLIIAFFVIKRKEIVVKD
ncbi:MDR family MFS transporter [uncultured Clostridium sp.]|uniref:MDR family MFS transporter n=1 Tax=uncultured Clostridium sp. TaxID=59620 RepID=UPI0025EA1A6E|nr:MDR family MFS transporter [uncultured Clostridium sp.]